MSPAAPGDQLGRRLSRRALCKWNSLRALEADPQEAVGALGIPVAHPAAEAAPGLLPGWLTRRARGRCRGGGLLLLRVGVPRVGVPARSVFLLPRGDGLQIQRVERERIRRAEHSEIVIVDERAGIVGERVRCGGARCGPALAAGSEPVGPDPGVVALLANTGRAVLIPPGRPLPADATASLTAHPGALRCLVLSMRNEPMNLSRMCQACLT